MTIPAESVDLVIAFEGYLRRLSDDRAAPYLCPARVATIGYGSTRYFPGKMRVTMADSPITRERARDCMMGELIDCELAVLSLTRAALHPLMLGALVSFSYNCGTGAYRASTLRKCVNEGRWDEVPRQLAKWRMGGGRILAGLVRRRGDEAKMFMRGVAALKRNDAVDIEVVKPAVPKKVSPPKQQVPPAPTQWGVFVKWFFNQ